MRNAIMRFVLRPFSGSKLTYMLVLGAILGVTMALVTRWETFGQTSAYIVTELSGPGVPYRLNNLGDVAGRARNSLSGKTGATIWNHRSLGRTNLGNFAGGEYSSASGINDAGEASGASNIARS